MITDASITAVARAVTAVFEYLCTPEGQAQAKEWREDRTKLKSDVDSLVRWLQSLTGGG